MLLLFVTFTLGLFNMVFRRTLSVQVNKICHGKSREDIVAEFKSAYPQHSLVAVQVGFDTVRVTFENVEIFKEAHAHTHVPIFGQRCSVLGGGPPPVMVHLFDYPAELGDDLVRQVLSGFGEVRSVRRQKYIGSPDIETGTCLVLMTFKTPPFALFIIMVSSAAFGTRANP